jgi:hypothetical protein
MYRQRHDERAGLAVWFFDGAEDYDWESHFAGLREIAGWAKPAGRRVAAILIFRDGSSWGKPETGMNGAGLDLLAVTCAQTGSQHDRLRLSGNVAPGE